MLKTFIKRFLNAFKKSQNNCQKIQVNLNNSELLNLNNKKLVFNADIEYLGFPDCEEKDVILTTSKGYFDREGNFHPKN